MKAVLIAVGTICMSALFASSAGAGDAKDSSAEEKAMQDRAVAMKTAFNNGDAKALAEFWTPNGDYVDENGKRYQGRKEIEESFQKLFAAGKGAELRTHITSRRFITPDVAIVDGVMEVIPPNDGVPTSANYTAVHVKRDGQWYLESVRESVAVAPSQVSRLEPLAWLIGEWVDEANKGESAKISFSWAENQNFIVSNFVTALKNVPVAGATQWIGWDASNNHIRSWTFDSTGGFSEAVWTMDGDRLTSKTTTTLRDGKKASSTSIVTKVDANHITWRSVNRTLDGKPIPDVPEVKMKRAQSE